MMPYERFDAWKMADRLAITVYQETDNWPYSLRFARQRGLLDAESFRALDDLRDQAGKLTWGRYASLTPPKTP
jgi:hypothetical protein